MLIVVLCSSLVVSAHPGKTDGNGGHTDSETDEYHYHHGYPAHEHKDLDGDGTKDCPYDFDDKTGQNSGSSGNSSSGNSSSANSSNAHTNKTPSSNLDNPKEQIITIDVWRIALGYLCAALIVSLLLSFLNFTDDILRWAVRILLPLCAVFPTMLLIESSYGNTPNCVYVFPDLGVIFSTWQYYVFAISLSVLLGLSLWFDIIHKIKELNKHWLLVFNVSLMIFSGIFCVPALLLLVLVLGLCATPIAIIISLWNILKEFVLCIIKKFCKWIKSIHSNKQEYPPPSPEDTALQSASAVSSPIESSAKAVSALLWSKTESICAFSGVTVNINQFMYIWAVFFYVVVKSTRNQDFILSVYSYFDQHALQHARWFQHYSSPVPAMRAAYRQIRPALNALKIDLSTDEGKTFLWNLIAKNALSDTPYPSTTKKKFDEIISMLYNYPYSTKEVHTTDERYSVDDSEYTSTLPDGV